MASQSDDCTEGLGALKGEALDILAWLKEERLPELLERPQFRAALDAMDYEFAMLARADHETKVDHLGKSSLALMKLLHSCAVLHQELGTTSSSRSLLDTTDLQRSATFDLRRDLVAMSEDGTQKGGKNNRVGPEPRIARECHDHEKDDEDDRTAAGGSGAGNVEEERPAWVP
jgi:hypothetical protein